MTETWRPEDHIPPEIAQLLARPSPNYVVLFLNIIELLKTQRRTGWLDMGIQRCESIADHMYRMGVTCMLIKDHKVNRDKCMRIALVHDMAEALVGDITPVDLISKEEKHRREQDTIEYLVETFIRPYNGAAADEILAAWLEYENIESLEARYVKDIDKFEMLVQCFEYEQRAGGTMRLDQFWSSAKMVKTEEIGGWVADLAQRRQQFWGSR